MADSISLDAHAERLRVIDEIVNGDSLTLRQGAALIPAHRGEGTAAASRLWHWATKGQKRADGVVIKLETAKFGTQILTSRAALARFAVALTAPTTDAEGSNHASAPRRSPSVRRKAGEAAAKRLAQAGA